MAATTITRESMTDNVTVWNVTRIGSAIYDKIDAVLGANITFGGLVSSEGFGSHTFSAGGTGANTLTLRNTTSGTGNYSGLLVGNNSTASLGALFGFSSAYTSAGSYYASGVTVESTGAGGLQLNASNASGPIRIFSGNTQRYAIDSAGVHTYLNSSVTLIPMADGTAAAPSISFASDTNTGIARTAADTGVLAAGGAAMLQWEDAGGGLARVTVKGYTGAASPGLRVERGTSSGFEAPGSLQLTDKDGVLYYLWVDTTGDLRISTTAVTGVTGDTIGTVVGTQA